jgi:hypothetical protein
MAKQQPTPHQLAVYQSRLRAIDRAWHEEQQSLFVNGQRPAWLGAEFALLMAFGLVLLVWSLRLLLAGEPVLRLALLMGVSFSAVGAYCAVWCAVQAYRLAGARRAYQRRRSEIRLEDCPREPERTPAADHLTAEEEAAGKYLLDQD